MILSIAKFQSESILVNIINESCMSYKEKISDEELQRLLLIEDEDDNIDESIKLIQELSNEDEDEDISDEELERLKKIRVELDPDEEEDIVEEDEEDV